MGFRDKLNAAIKKNDSRVCIGLDPDPEKIPPCLKKNQLAILEFNKAIIEQTADIVCAYKPNMAFYEALGFSGIQALKNTIDMIPSDIPVILDAKRGDIGNTSARYAHEIFEIFGADATTLSPYMGFDSIEPFLKYQDRTSFVLCLTSNKGSVDFQKQKLKPDGKFLYEIVAQKCSEWNTSGNIGLVIGATDSDELRRIREICPDMILLIPGVGAQGGSLEKSVKYGLTPKGEIIINSSRDIIYASADADFAKKARQAAIKLRDEINRAII
jgi:orotidine-5'-phosphate decarboxylase